MKRAVVGVAAAVILLACSGDDDPECANIAGNWSVRSRQVGGVCSLGDQTLEISMRRDSGQWEVVLPGIEGGCRGAFDQAACRFTSTCDFFDKESRKIASSGIDWTFDGRSFTGSTISRVLNSPSVGDCTANYADTGTKL